MVGGEWRGGGGQKDSLLLVVDRLLLFLFLLLLSPEFNMRRFNKCNVNNHNLNESVLRCKSIMSSMKLSNRGIADLLATYVDENCLWMLLGGAIPVLTMSFDDLMHEADGGQVLSEGKWSTPPPSGTSVFSTHIPVYSCPSAVCSLLNPPNPPNTHRQRSLLRRVHGQRDRVLAFTKHSVPHGRRPANRCKQSTTDERVLDTVQTY